MAEARGRLVIKSKKARDRKAASLLRKIQAHGRPTNPKHATARWSDIVELSEATGIPVVEIRARLRRGWDDGE